MRWAGVNGQRAGSDGAVRWDHWDTPPLVAFVPRPDGGANNFAVGRRSMIFKVGTCFSDAGAAKRDGGTWSELELGAGAE